MGLDHSVGSLSQLLQPVDIVGAEGEETGYIGFLHLVALMQLTVDRSQPLA